MRLQRRFGITWSINNYEEGIYAETTLNYGQPGIGVGAFAKSGIRTDWFVSNNVSDPKPLNYCSGKRPGSVHQSGRNDSHNLQWSNTGRRIG
jgi:hypothetical protein